LNLHNNDTHSVNKLLGDDTIPVDLEFIYFFINMLDVTM